MDEKQLKIYKKYTIILLLATAAALVVCAAALSFKRAVKNSPQPSGMAPQAVITDHYTPKQAASQETPAPTAAPAGYTVTLHGGYVAILRVGDPTPVLLSETQAYLLPQEDIELLRKGIPASTLAQAKALLEDYD